MTSTREPSLVSEPASRAAVHRLANAELSMPSRLGHVVLLIAAAMMTTVVGSLWITEPALPVRTQVGFTVMVLIGLSWVAFALWVLSRRRPLFARHRIIAGRMAVVFTSLFVIGAVAVAYTRGGRAAYAAGGVGMVMLAAAVVLLVRAERMFLRLTERREDLERELGKSSG
jgi:hypothetical protein